MAIDLSKLKNKVAEINNNGGSGQKKDTKFYNIQDGDFYLRILPPTDKDKDFWAETKLHYLKTNGKINRVPCPRAHDNSNSCPICDQMFAHYKTGEKEKGKAIKPVARYFFNVLDRETNEVKILSTGITVYQKIMEQLLDPDYAEMFDKYPDGLLDTTNGHDFKLVRYQESGYPKYDRSTFRPKASKLAESNKEIDTIMGSAHDLSLEAPLGTYEEAKRAIEEYNASQVNQASNSSNSSDNDEEDFNNKISRGVKVS